MHGDARLSGCWIVIANYIPFLLPDWYFKKSSILLSKLEPSEFFGYYVYIAIASYHTKHHLTVKLPYASKW